MASRRRSGSRLAIESRQPESAGFFVPFDGDLALTDPEGQVLRRWNDHPIDTGPVLPALDGRVPAPGFRSNRAGISELLDTRWLNHPLVNWMIPYRLRRPDR